MSGLSRLLTNLIPVWGIDVVLNGVLFVISSYFKTEKLYDITGTQTYTLTTLFAVARALSIHKTLHFRQILAAFTTILWSTRLGLFLYNRVHKLKGDRRFDKVKDKPLLFSVFWIMQAVWIALTALPVHVCLTLPPALQSASSWTDLFGVSLWALGFAIEISADRQKFNWQTKHGENRFRKVLNVGLFKYCRYPNYFGEILLWCGSYTFCANAFKNDLYSQSVLAISPVFVTCLLTLVSGIPIQEKMAKDRYKDVPEYTDYANATNKLIPWFPKKKTN